jgi:hypothetical protein
MANGPIIDGVQHSAPEIVDPPKPVKTIEFNTGRLYTKEGQFIKATLHSDGYVTFMDHSRSIDGGFKLPRYASFDRVEIMHHYDHNNYNNTPRSWQDGMLRNGCNAREAKNG